MKTALVLGPLLCGSIAAPARADQGSIAGRDVDARRPIQRPGPAAARRGEGLAGPSGGWWFGTAGVALALALFGGISLASRRFLPQAGSGGFLGVVGRVRLSPRHSVTLLRVGGRVLILGTGSQGSPTLLGELSDPAELHRLAPRRPDRIGSGPGPSVRGFDRLVGDGDDE